MAEILQAKKARYALHMEGFCPGNNFRIRAVTITSQQQLNKRSEANQAPLKMGLLANNRQHMIRQFNVWGEEVKQFINPNMVSSSRWSIIMDIMTDQ